ncbi:MAG: DUF6492 family protein [Pseudomonadota bacterium]
MALEVARQKLSLHWNRKIASRFTRDDAASDQPLSIMIPVAPKDVDRAAVSIPIIREKVSHPINRIAVVAPDHPHIRDLCERLDVGFIDEMVPLRELLNERLDETSGWIRQQFLKLDSPRIVGDEDVLVMDSDTYPLRPVAFSDADGRQILYNGDANQAPFHRFTEAALGPLPPRPANFIAHCMILHGPFLQALHTEIEARHNKPWAQALLDLAERPTEDVGSMSEYDLYGQFVARTFPTRVTQRWYANIKVTTPEFLGDAPLPAWKRRFRFISNHQRG